jgi:aminoglycoside phosphotransferase (APT) family kinase protein
MHPDQLSLTSGTVRRLVGEQFPAWADLDVRRVDGPGTVNAIFRLGHEFAARFPLVGDDPGPVRRQLEAEAAAARELHGRTRFATPAPVAVGRPGSGFALPWSVQTWLEGSPAVGVRTGRTAALAHDVVELITELRAVPTRGRVFAGSNRGGELTTHDGWMATCFDRSEGLLDAGALRRFWTRARELPRGPDPDVMSHTDLTPANLLVVDGRLTGVLDVGDFSAADPALDLVAAWHLFDAEDREIVRAGLSADELPWLRGRAWAFEQAVGLVAYYATSNPAMSSLGRTTLGRILADEDRGSS